MNIPGISVRMRHVGREITEREREQTSSKLEENTDLDSGRLRHSQPQGPCDGDRAS